MRGAPLWWQRAPGSPGPASSLAGPPPRQPATCRQPIAGMAAHPRAAAARAAARCRAVLAANKDKVWWC